MMLLFTGACTPFRSLLGRLVAFVVIGAALTLPARADDLQYRQNGTNLLLDAHADQALVAITLGLSPRVGPAQALLPVATLSVIEPLPSSTGQWQSLLSDLAAHQKGCCAPPARCSGTA